MTQIYDYVLDPQMRDTIDSISEQKETFEIQKTAASLISPKEEKEMNDLEMTEDRVRLYIKSEDEFEKIKNESKEYSNFVVDKTESLEIGKSNDNLKV